jgi:predicted peroxiredoxin
MRIHTPIVYFYFSEENECGWVYSPAKGWKAINDVLHLNQMLASAEKAGVELYLCESIEEIESYDVEDVA